MPTNYSENKLRVSRLFGTDQADGYIDARLTMVTDKGTITQVKDSGRYLVSVSGAGVGMPSDFYPHELRVAYAHATGSWAYPTGVGSVRFGHAQIWPDGPPVTAGTGMYYSDGDGAPTVFSRP